MRSLFACLMVIFSLLGVQPAQAFVGPLTLGAAEIVAGGNAAAGTGASIFGIGAAGIGAMLGMALFPSSLSDTDMLPPYRVPLTNQPKDVPVPKDVPSTVPFKEMCRSGQTIGGVVVAYVDSELPCPGYWSVCTRYGGHRFGDYCLNENSDGEIQVFAGTVIGCPSGYIGEPSGCVLHDRNKIPDDDCPVTRSGGGYSFPAGDPDCGSSEDHPMPGKIQPDGSILISGTDANGNPLYYNVKPTPDGGSHIDAGLQQTAPNGDTLVKDLDIDIGPDGTLDSVQQGTAPGSVDADNGESNKTGDDIPPAQNIDFPDDYARQGEAEEAQKATRTQLKPVTDAFVAQSEPVDPSIPEVDLFENYFRDEQGRSFFRSLLNWALTDPGYICPSFDIGATWKGQFFGSHEITSHCGLLEDNRALIGAVMQVTFILSALFIVLKA